MNRRFWVVSTLLAVTVVGCGSSTEPQIERDAAPDSVQSSPAPTASEPALPDVAAFGDTVTFSDGLTVTIQSAGLKTASAYAAGAVEGKIAAVQITVTNGSDEVVDAVGVSALTATAGEAGKPAPPAGDDGITNSSLGSVLPGETKTGVFGYGLSAIDAQKVRLEIYGNTLEDRVVFAGAIS